MQSPPDLNPKPKLSKFKVAAISKELSFNDEPRGEKMEVSNRRPNMSNSSNSSNRRVEIGT